MKEKIEIFKIIWSNKRYRAIIELSIYILFFATIFIASKIIGSQNKIVIDNNDYQDKYPYYFNAIINSDAFSGTIYEDRIEIIYNNANYYYADNITISELFPYSVILPYIDYYKVKENELYSKTEYNNGLIEETYIINNYKIVITTNNGEISLIIDDNQNKYYIYYSK